MTQRSKKSSDASRDAARILDWYGRNRRDLPWRRERGAYPILVSEVMLQQTRVETVLAYYEKFLERFPSVQKLAEAPLEEVLGAWSGLGYYRRARQLHRAARQIVERDGRVPRTPEELRQLPGVGAYTAAAVASIAFGVVVPAVDGNLERVVARRFGIEGDVRRAPARSEVEACARELIDPDRPGDSNQALMEIGATVCRPRGPRCGCCPLEETCFAAETGSAESYPAPRQRPAVRRSARQVAVVRDGARLLLFRRPDDSGRLAGMWELPWINRTAEGLTEEAFASRYGGRWHLAGPLTRLRHSITNNSYEIEVLEGRLDFGSSVAEGLEASWFETSELDGLPLSSLVRKVLGKSEAHE